MKNLKSYIFLVLAVCLSGSLSSLFGQNVFWIDSDFDNPRIVKTGADSSELLSQNLEAGSQPQGLVVDAKDDRLYWNNLSFINAKLLHAPSDLVTITTILDSQSVLRGIAVDSENSKIYWTSTNLVSGPKISRANMDGTAHEVLIDFGPGSNDTPRSISLDLAAGKMYWANFGAGKIQQADLVMGPVSQDVVTGLNGPSGITVDSDSGKIFWTEMNSGQIKTANLDGTDITLLVDGLSAPNYISTNRKLNRMAWTEMGPGKVKSADLDGTNILDYAVNATAPTGVFIEPPEDTTIVVTGDLHILPQDTTVQVQNYVQFDAMIIDSSGIAHDTDADWFVKKNRVGPISDDGQLFTYFPGNSKIMAKRDTMSAKACLSVIDTTTDESGANLISITRVFPWFKAKHPKSIKEGMLYTLGGLPHPFNLINGISVYFPIGSLHEDITLEVTLPRLALIRKDTVEFANRIINAIEFNVFVDDSLVKPYYFDKPISIALPFKRGILKRLGVNVSNLGLFFAKDSISFDSLGISHVSVDSTNNRIYGLVEHFSSLVVREKQQVTSIKTGELNTIKPKSFVLKQNYPNPFNPLTTIEYQVPTTSHVNLSIYNILGQKVQTLVSVRQTEGVYKVTWDAGKFSSGVYFYRLETDNGFIKSKKLILLK